MYINEALQLIAEEEDTADQYELAKKIGTSQGTVSNYMKGGTYPNIKVAGFIYGTYGHIVEPFTEKALIKEWEYQRKYNGN